MIYPPNKKECAQLLDELIQLDAVNNRSFHARKYEIIHDLAEAHYYEARPTFVQGLDHPDPDYRWACINALAIHWHDKDSAVVKKIIHLADHDLDTQVRMIAISALGFLQIRTAIPLLNRIARSKKEDSDLIKSAREALTFF